MAAGGRKSPAIASNIVKRAKESGVLKIIGDCDFGISKDFAYVTKHIQARGRQATYIVISTNHDAGHHDSHYNFDKNTLPNAAQNTLLHSCRPVIGRKLQRRPSFAIMI